MLDRTIKPSTPLGEAMKIAFLSFDASIRSNLAVARPLDLMVMPAAPHSRILTRRISDHDPYFDDLSERWGEALREVSQRIPNPPFMDDAGTAARRAAE